MHPLFRNITYSGIKPVSLPYTLAPPVASGPVGVWVVCGRFPRPDTTKVLWISLLVIPGKVLGFQSHRLPWSYRSGTRMDILTHRRGAIGSNKKHIHVDNTVMWQRFTNYMRFRHHSREGGGGRRKAQTSIPLRGSMKDLGLGPCIGGGVGVPIRDKQNDKGGPLVLIGWICTKQVSPTILGSEDVFSLPVSPAAPPAGRFIGVLYQVEVRRSAMLARVNVGWIPHLYTNSAPDFRLVVGGEDGEFDRPTVTMHFS